MVHDSPARDAAGGVSCGPGCGFPRGGIDEVREPKVADGDVVGRRVELAEDIIGFDIPVNYFVLVKVFHAVEDGFEYGGGVAFLEYLVLRDDVAERVGVMVHDDEEGFGGLEDIMYAGNGHMVDYTADIGLPLDELEDPRVAMGNLGLANDLDGAEIGGYALAGRVHGGELPGSNGVAHLVEIRDLPARRGAERTEPGVELALIGEIQLDAMVEDTDEDR